MKRGAPSRLSLKGRALQLLAQREHSRLELRRKLLPYAALDAVVTEAGAAVPYAAAEPASAMTSLPAAEPLFERSTARRAAVTPEVAAQVDALLDWLEAQGHLSDARFVESRVRARAPRLGTLRIRQELARHGAELPPDALQALKAGEASRAAAVWQRKFGEPAADAGERARQMRFLAARGFDPEVVRRVVPAARRRDDAEPGDG